ncbi:Putative heterokaryon incompatibility [Septoria linicola]|uniref:Heterokaryon incompatibility n=1 Tax=Septoria linicola TaxID=215465 RepID=A0A9Q9ATU6_9PEZI|nr:Putative heterokaryon incompatibility [Septoria linicola]
MPLCTVCTSLPLSVNTLRDNDVAFHDSLVCLKASAAAGCPFCHLCFMALKRGTTARVFADALEAQNPEPIYLNGAYDDTVQSENVVDIGYTMGSSISVSVGKTHFGRLGEKNSGSTDVLVYLNVYAQPETPAGKWIRGRLYTGTQDSLDSQFDLIKYWLERCTRWHRRCHGLSSGFMPTRLIHIGGTSSKTRLVDRPDVQEPYVALSYCWGGNHGLRLVNDNLEKLKIHIDESAMNNTNREAVEVARHLGISYIWIDAICIVQGDAEDWARESIWHRCMEMLI